MQNKQRLESEIELTSTLKIITQAYEEIAVMRMQKIRNAVLKTRVFLDSLDEVFIDVKSNYRQNIMSLFQHKKKSLAEMRALDKNGKKVAVLISTNSKLNGEIIPKVFREFLKHTESETTDIAIVGKMGKQLFEQKGSKKPYQYFEIPENKVDTESLKSLVLALLAYKEVNMFYGKFESLLNQNPAVSNVTGDTIMAKTSTEEKNQTVAAYIFEPSIEKILEFFETQIFSSLVKQSVNEADLARYASRIRAMEEAMQHIDSTTKGLFAQKRKIKNLIHNKKQLEIMSRVAKIH